MREISHDAGYVVATEGDPGAGAATPPAEGEADVTIGGREVNHLGEAGGILR